MKNSALWQRIESVEFTDSNASLDFIHRLMRENQWSTSFALAAVFEYKRFAYLAMVCEHEVTPSDEVDQVWHLHLQYSRHYWGKWTEVLGSNLHHGPTLGGSSEALRFEDNYARTLASYEHEFGLPPPADLWPDASIRFSRPQRMVRIDAQDYPWRPRNWTTLALAMKSIVVFGLFAFSIGVIINHMGKSFLFLWLLLIFVVFVVLLVYPIIFSLIDSICGVETRKGNKSGGAISGGCGGVGFSNGDAGGGESGGGGGGGCGGGCGS